MRYHCRHVNDLTAQSLIDGIIAIGLGVFIGLEREHSEVEPEAAGVITEETSAPKPRGTEHLGVRTFALVALFGWLSGLLEPVAHGISLVGLAVAGALIGLQYVRTWKAGAGVTTEVAALVTFGLGLLIRKDRLLTVAMALVVTLLLIAKPWVRKLVAHIERRELTATLQLAIMLAIVLPLLPAEARDPWGVLGPRRLGFFVVFIAGINFVGYVLARWFGTRSGAGLSGLLGGLVSSTAVTAAMAQRSRRSDAMIVPAQLTTFLANAVMFVRVIVVCAVLSPETATQLAVPMGVMSAVMLVGALGAWRALGRQGTSPENEMSLQNPFALLPALKWGALLAAILVVVAIAKQHFGDRGLIVAAGIAGLADVDAINVAVSRQATMGSLNVNLAVLAITTATLSNTVSKAVISLASGGRRFGQPIALVFAAAMAAGLIAALLV